MKFNTLGKSGPRISLIGLGCVNFGLLADFNASRQVIHKALDLGITFFDTSPSYGQRSASEEFLGRTLGARRKDVVLATKFGYPVKGVDPKGTLARASYPYIMTSIEASLKRLGTDWIDVYQMHSSVPATPIEETLRALHDLVRQGKVRFIGCCNFTAVQLAEALQTATKHELPAFMSCQNEYNLLVRRIEGDLIPAIKVNGQGLLAYAPLASGLLSGKYRRDAPLPENVRLSVRPENAKLYLTDANFRIVENLRAFAARRDHTMIELALSWLAAHDAVSGVITGAMTPEQIEANVRAIERQLSAEDLAEIDRITSQSDEG